MLIRFLVNAAALAVATWLIPGITLTGSSMGARAGALAVVAALFGILNAIVRPLFEPRSAEVMGVP